MKNVGLIIAVGLIGYGLYQRTRAPAAPASLISRPVTAASVAAAATAAKSTAAKSSGGGGASIPSVGSGVSFDLTGLLKKLLDRLGLGGGRPLTEDEFFAPVGPDFDGASQAFDQDFFFDTTGGGDNGVYNDIGHIDGSAFSGQV